MASHYYPDYSGLFRLINDFDRYTNEANTNHDDHAVTQSSPSPNSTTTKPRNGMLQQLIRGHGGVPTFTPKFDLQETANTYILHGDLPGIDKKDVNVEFADDQTVFVRGKVEKSYSSSSDHPAEDEGVVVDHHEGGHNSNTDKVSDNPAERKGDEDNHKGEQGNVEKSQQHKFKARYWVLERSYGEFSRSFKFPTRVDPDGVRAKLDNGVLTVMVPKIRKTEGKKVSIQ